MKKLKKRISILMIAVMMMAPIVGCGKVVEEESDDNVSSDNIVLTETGEVLVVPQPTKEAEQSSEEVEQQEEPEAEATQTPDFVEPQIHLEEPKQEQVITEEDQTEPTGSEMQIVFLGDSIFDNNRDGTGVPFLTAEQCGADVYNLAIGGTSATLEPGESESADDWHSLSLVSVVRALKGEVSTDCFAGTRTKEILDNDKIDWSNTDYFVVEYGINDFLRAAPKDAREGMLYDMYAYSGALRYAVSNLGDVAHDATIILCSPHYCQFFNGEQFIGDGNVLNTGHGTLFDYKGTCEYVAKEQQVHFFDAYMDLGIDGYTAEDYLEDGIHLTKEGRQLYADALAEMIMNIEETKNN